MREARLINLGPIEPRPYPSINKWLQQRQQERDGPEPASIHQCPSLLPPWKYKRKEVQFYWEGTGGKSLLSLNRQEISIYKCVIERYNDTN